MTTVIGLANGKLFSLGDVVRRYMDFSLLSATTESLLLLYIFVMGLLSLNKSVVYYVSTTLFLWYPTPSFVRCLIFVILSASHSVSLCHCFLIISIEINSAAHHDIVASQLYIHGSRNTQEYLIVFLPCL